MTQFTVTEGYLYKKHRLLKLWTKRYVVVNDVGFFYFRKREEVGHREPLGKIKLEELSVFVTEINKPKRRYCFKLFDKRKSVAYMLGSYDKEERNQWLSAVLLAVCQIEVAWKYRD